MIVRKIQPLYKLCFIIFLFRLSQCVVKEFSDCHDDFDLKPADGMLKEHSFPWLGFTQYIHVTTGLPHQSKAPRVVLIQKQFVLGTAVDMFHLPKNYKLGNIIFGDYERDEEECNLTMSQLKMGVRCGNAYLETPYTDIIPHPEFTRFGVGNSLALIKLMRPMKSPYVIPICFPSLDEREGQKKKKAVFLIDYISTVPRDFESEKMAKKTLRLYTHKECRRHRMRSRLGSEGITHVLCTSGCGMRTGAPIISHAITGSFELIGISAGGTPCSRRSMRNRLNTEPPIYIDVYPYNNWIINVITAHLIPLAYPQNFMLTDSGSGMAIRSNILRQYGIRKQRSAWRARTYVSGNACFTSVAKQKARLAMFYNEKFVVNADPPAKLNVYIEVLAGPEAKIMCVRMLMPNRFRTPEILGVGRHNISVRFTTKWFPYNFFFSLGIFAKNATTIEASNWDYENRYYKHYG